VPLAPARVGGDQGHATGVRLQIRGGLSVSKRERLIGAGAHLIVPDFRDHAALAAYLFAEV